MSTEPIPWTVPAFAEARQRTWRAIRVWLAILLLSGIAFAIPLRLEKDRATKGYSFSSGDSLALEDQTGAEIVLSIVSFATLLASVVAVTYGVSRHYRCPQCKRVPGTGGVALWPSKCSHCTARLS